MSGKSGSLTPALTRTAPPIAYRVEGGVSFLGVGFFLRFLFDTAESPWRFSQDVHYHSMYGTLPITAPGKWSGGSADGSAWHFPARLLFLVERRFFRGTRISAKWRRSWRRSARQQSGRWQSRERRPG